MVIKSGYKYILRRITSSIRTMLQHEAQDYNTYCKNIDDVMATARLSIAKLAEERKDALDETKIWHAFRYIEYATNQAKVAHSFSTNMKCQGDIPEAPQPERLKKRPPPPQLPSRMTKIEDVSPVSYSVAK